MKSFSKLKAMFLFLVISFSTSELYAGFSWWSWTPGDSVDHVGYSPTQPIPFSHKLHVTDKAVPCQFCHSSARRSIVSGVPPLNTCMACHRFIKTDSPHIKKITSHFKQNKPFPWIKVHDLPDFVRFPHNIHVSGSKKLECQTCHGKVENMEVVKQVAPLQMGWCLDCHRKEKATTRCLSCHY